MACPYMVGCPAGALLVVSSCCAHSHAETILSHQLRGLCPHSTHFTKGRSKPLIIRRNLALRVRVRRLALASGAWRWRRPAAPVRLRAGGPEGGAPPRGPTPGGTGRAAPQERVSLEEIEAIMRGAALTAVTHIQLACCQPESSCACSMLAEVLRPCTCAAQRLHLHLSWPGSKQPPVVGTASHECPRVGRWCGRAGQLADLACHCAGQVFSPGAAPPHSPRAQAGGSALKRGEAGGESAAAASSKRPRLDAGGA